MMITLACLMGFLAPQPARAADEFLENPSKPLPALHYKDENGAVQTVNAKGNKLTMLHFWATWCVPCIAELPIVDGIAAHYASKGLRVLSFSVDTNQDKVKQFFTDNNITHLTPYLDNNNASFIALDLGGLPTTVFVNARGEEIARGEGPIDWSAPSVVKFLDAALK